MTDEKKSYVTMDVVALERLIPRHAYVGDLTLTENLSNYIEWLKSEVDHWKGASKEHAEARTERDELLAVIHRDGGHYVGEHGVTKAVADAHATWAAVVQERDEARANIATLDAHWLAKFAAETTRASQLEAEVERLRAHWRKVIGGPDIAPGQETEVYETLSATVERYADDAARLRKLLGDKAQLSSEKLSAAFTEGTLAAGDAMRDHLHSVAEAQREACAKVLDGPDAVSAAEVRATPLVTEVDK